MPELLTVADVMARYDLRDRRAARRLMDGAGAFMVCGRLLVAADDLAAYEAAKRAERAAARRPTATTDPAPRRRATCRQREPRPAGWWR